MFSKLPPRLANGRDSFDVFDKKKNIITVSIILTFLVNVKYTLNSLIVRTNKQKTSREIREIIHILCCVCRWFLDKHSKIKVVNN